MEGKLFPMAQFIKDSRACPEQSGADAAHLAPIRPQKGKPMVDYLTYYYKSGTEPFRSLSALPDEEAIKIMEELCDDTPFGARFKDPVQYMRNRRQAEQWVREEFIAKGGATPGGISDSNGAWGIQMDGETRS
jgi:hypothetical protein